MHGIIPSPAAALILVSLLSASGAIAGSCDSPTSSNSPDDGIGIADAGMGTTYSIASEPEEFATDVVVNKIIRVKFNEHLDGRAISNTYMSLTSGTVFKWLFTYYEPVDKELVIWASSPMRKNAVWVLSFEEGLMGIDGSEVTPMIVTSFKTGDNIGDEIPYENRTYLGDIKDIFDNRCVSCHGPEGGRMAGIDLSSESGIKETTMEVTSAQWPTWKRLVANHPAQSYLLYKVIGDGPVGGKQMPRVLAEEEEAEPLTNEQQKMISDWIVSGALF